jgi:hypothetical protein
MLCNSPFEETEWVTGSPTYVPAVAGNRERQRRGECDRYCDTGPARSLVRAAYLADCGGSNRVVADGAVREGCCPCRVEQDLRGGEGEWQRAGRIPQDRREDFERTAEVAAVRQ